MWRFAFFWAVVRTKTRKLQLRSAHEGKSSDCDIGIHTIMCFLLLRLRLLGSSFMIRESQKSIAKGGTKKKLSLVMAGGNNKWGLFRVIITRTEYVLYSPSPQRGINRPKWLARSKGKVKEGCMFIRIVLAFFVGFFSNGPSGCASNTENTERRHMRSRLRVPSREACARQTCHFHVKCLMCVISKITGG